MLLKYKKGDILTRIIWKYDKFIIVKYETINDSTITLKDGTSVMISLRMIHTNDKYLLPIRAENHSIFISTTFTDDGIENRTSDLGDLFIIGDKEETINKAEAIMLVRYNKCFREEYLRKKKNVELKYDIQNCLR